MVVRLREDSSSRSATCIALPPSAQLTSDVAASPSDKPSAPTRQAEAEKGSAQKADPGSWIRRGHAPHRDRDRTPHPIPTRTSRTRHRSILCLSSAMFDSGADVSPPLALLTWLRIGALRCAHYYSAHNLLPCIVLSRVSPATQQALLDASLC